MAKQARKLIANNKKVYHDYFLEETFEAGIALAGTEVKSIRLGQCNLKDCYGTVKDGELWVYGMHISPYEKGSFSNTDPIRPKRMLMHKAEIRKLQASVMQKGLAIVPLNVYLKDGRVKAEIGLCKGKKLYDKRDDMARRDAGREMERTLKDKNFRT